MSLRPRLGCIADDFTGATDLANTLVRSGLRCVQTIGVPGLDEQIEADAVVVALKSRTIPAAEAVAQSLAALRWLKAAGCQQFFFKVCSTFDSTPAGNIGPVTDALLDALCGLNQGLTVACPAFPLNGRTVYLGHLFVGEQLLSDSGMRDHPLTPMTDSNLVRVMQAQTRRRVGRVSLPTVRAGAAALRARLLALQVEGVGVAIVDAVEDADLMRLGEAVVDFPLVVAGSGLGIGLAGPLRAQGDPIPEGAVDTLPPARGHAAVIAGSCSQATQAQVAHWRAQGRPAYAIDPLALAAGEPVVARTLAAVLPLLADGPVLIHATDSPEAVRRVQAQLGVEAAGRQVEAALSGLALALVQQGVRRLVVAGGETSGAVVQALGVRRMAIGPQIDPGVPWTAAASAACGDEPLHLALKSGNFGGTDFFERAFSLLPTA